MTRKSLVFLGHGGWAAACLGAVYEWNRFRIPAVFLHGSSAHGQEDANAELESLARRRGCLVIRLDEVTGMKDVVERMAPDLIVCVGFLKKIPPSVLEIPTNGAVNLHGALLPRYRGRAPISWALMNGEKFVGITVHYMKEEIDAGPIIVQHRVRVSSLDTAATLYEKMKRLAPAVLLDALRMFEQGAPEGVPQDERAASRYGRLTPEVCLVRWDAPAAKIHDKIRALVPPYPGAFTFARGRRYVLLRSSVMEAAGETGPGKVLAVSSRGTAVGTGRGTILIEEAAPEGGAPGAPDWEAGETLGGNEAYA